MLFRSNAAFAFTSLGVKVDHTVTTGAGPYSFRISGNLCHLSGALLPPPNQAPVFAQIYIHDPAEQLFQRTQNNANLNPAVMVEIQGVFNQTHAYIPLYKQACQIMSENPEDQHDSVVLHLCAECTQDLRCYNLPTADDNLVEIIPGDGSEIRSNHRDIVLRLKEGDLQRISHLHPAYASLHYVLLFPHGENGWHTGIPAQPGDDGQQRAEEVSQRCYHAYRLQKHPGEQPLLLWGGNLFKQHVVDAWASVE